jgi:antitoxin (DNA-binding transcriptional repressor) of toxin-antitoxin stability system
MWTQFTLGYTMQVSIRELKANPARAIAAIRPGEPVQITSHRKVVAELVAPARAMPATPPMSDAQAMQRLLDSGLVSKAASQAKSLPEPVIFSAAPDGKTMSDLVIELRGPQ